MKPEIGAVLYCIRFRQERIFVGSLGQVAQLVEQWTENPCVGGSIPSLTTPCSESVLHWSPQSSTDSSKSGSCLPIEDDRIFSAAPIRSSFDPIPIDEATGPVVQFG